MRLLNSMVVGLLLYPAWGRADKEPTPPTAVAGTYVRTANECTLTFTFQKNTFTFALKDKAGARVTTTCSYTLANGTVTAKVTAVTQEGTSTPTMVGDQVTFTIEQKNDTLTLKDIQTPKSDPVAKKLVEGDYTRKTAKDD